MVHFYGIWKVNVPIYNNWVFGRIKSKSCLDVDFEYLNWYTHTFRRPLLQKNKSQNFLTIGAAPRCWLRVTGLDCWIVGWLSLQQRTMTTVCLYMGEQKMHAITLYHLVSEIYDHFCMWCIANNTSMRECALLQEIRYGYFQCALQKGKDSCKPGCVNRKTDHPRLHQTSILKAICRESSKVVDLSELFQFIQIQNIRWVYRGPHNVTQIIWWVCFVWCLYLSNP